MIGFIVGYAAFVCLLAVFIRNLLPLCRSGNCCLPDVGEIRGFPLSRLNV